MANKQVMGGKEGREGLGQARTRSHPPRDRFSEGSVQEEGRTGGTLSSGGSLEPRCLQKIFTCIRHAGPVHCAARWAPGDAGAISP